VGDQVLLKLQPYVQSSVATKAHHKLAFKFFVPYTIIEKIGSVAYKVALPTSSSVHPTFHVSQLKKVVSNPSQISSSLPDSTTAMHQIPGQVLGSKLVRQGEAVTAQVLIK
jgi:hypothetical protein